MTLVTTEIWMQDTPFVVMAADRRITRGAEPDSNRQKLFALPSGRLAGTSYFGLAEIRVGLWMDEWLRDFLNHHTGAPTLSDVAEALAVALNGVAGLDRKQVSGFQLAGLTADGRPEFWYVRNVDDDGLPTFGEWRAREDFQARDAWRLGPGEAAVYRNGDYRAHVAAWEDLDLSFGRLLVLPGFGQQAGPQARLQMVRFKMDVIASFYDQFASNPVVGRPVDALLITQAGVTWWRRRLGLPTLPVGRRRLRRSGRP